METITRYYRNPVYEAYLADPFVWEFDGTYYAIGTGPIEASGEVPEAEASAPGLSSEFRIFPLLRSDDFVTWHAYGGALAQPDPELGDTFWAPEIASHDGLFYLYYSVGFADRDHQIRVATSRHPLGPYRDERNALVDAATTPFAIDPHPFRDDDGSWYLFYASDYLDTEGGAYAGTALSVDRMLDMTTLAGEPQTVLRSHYPWQLFMRNREMYGRIWDWYTLEGPTVRKHEGRYYCFFSGGRWDSDRYGVDYATADAVMGPYADGGSAEGPRILHSVPEHMIGPGHSSVVIGPDRETEYLVYHAWDAARTARYMCLDRLSWTPGGPRCEGPTWTPQEVRAVIGLQSRL